MYEFYPNICAWEEQEWNRKNEEGKRRRENMEKNNAVTKYKRAAGVTKFSSLHTLEMLLPEAVDELCN